MNSRREGVLLDCARVVILGGDDLRQDPVSLKSILKRAHSANWCAERRESRLQPEQV
jgi:hypothetical protein